LHFLKCYFDYFELEYYYIDNIVIVAFGDDGASKNLANFFLTGIENWKIWPNSARNSE
jgi:hypothetical protein